MLSEGIITVLCRDYVHRIVDSGCHDVLREQIPYDSHCA